MHRYRQNIHVIFYGKETSFEEVMMLHTKTP